MNLGQFGLWGLLPGYQTFLSKDFGDELDFWWETCLLFLDLASEV